MQGLSDDDVLVLAWKECGMSTKESVKSNQSEPMEVKQDKEVEVFKEKVSEELRKPKKKIEISGMEEIKAQLARLSVLGVSSEE